MKHKIFILTSGKEVYIMVRKAYLTREFLVDIAFRNDKHFEMKSPVLARFIRDNVKTLEFNTLPVPEGIKFETLKEVLDYRQMIISQYDADGWIVLDEKTDELMNKSADENFGEVLKRIDISAAVKKFGKNLLLKARKELTVSEFIEAYGV